MEINIIAVHHDCNICLKKEERERERVNEQRKEGTRTRRRGEDVTDILRLSISGQWSSQGYYIFTEYHIPARE